MSKKRNFLLLLGVNFLVFSACSSQKTQIDATSGATVEDSVAENSNTISDNIETPAIIFVYSHHHGSTRKIANAIAPIINARIINIPNNGFSSLEKHELIGFGSGINSDKHFQLLLDFAETLPNVQNKKAFIFSTSGIYSKEKMLKDHDALRTILQNKGFIIVGEFGCLGHNTNSFLRFFGGMNKGRPNSEDIKNAELFAERLMDKKEFL
jgi:flavodoxin